MSFPLFTRLAAGFVAGVAATPALTAGQFVAATAGTQGGSPVQKPGTMLREIHHSQTGQAVYVFALPKQH